MPDDVYEARFGFNSRVVTLTAVSLLFAAAAFLPIWEEGSVLRIADLIFFGGGSLLFIFAAARGKTALRVDWGGVTLGGHPLRFGDQSVVVPWSDIVGVDLWLWRAPVYSHGHQPKTPYVTLRRREGAPALPGAHGGRVLGSVNSSLLGISPNLLSSSRAVNMWRLDRAQFVNTVGRYAPHIAIRVTDDFPKK